MSFGPKTVIKWYKSRKSKWVKVGLFVFIVLGVALAAVWWALTRATSPGVGSKSEPLTVVTDALEEEYREDVEEVIAVVERNNEEIEDLKEQRVELEQQRVDGMKQNEAEHKRTDSASDAASVVAAIAANRGRRRTDKAD